MAKESLTISIIAFVLVVTNLFVAISLSVLTGEVIFESLGTIGLFSVALFALICLVALQSDSIYFTFLIFIMIAFPSIVDNILPGILIGLEGGNKVAFPLLTHIDIYLIIGIVKGIVTNDKVRVRGNWIYFSSIVVLMFSFILNIIYNSNSIYEYLLLSTGLYHLRYLILIYLLLSVYDVSLFKKSLINSVYISILFLLVESLITTNTIGSLRLTSGTLNLNTLGNITAQIGLVLAIIGFRFKLLKLSNSVLVLVIFISFYISIATETRIAILSVIGVLAFLFVSNWKKVRTFLRIIFALSIAMIAIVFIDWKNILPARYYPITLIENTELKLANSDLNEIISIKLTAETSSIITRLDLFQTSLNMIYDNPIIGIGSNRWNYQKSNYGSDVKVLINSHNGYLNVIAEYGIFALVLLFFIYFYPIRVVFNKIRDNSIADPIMYFALINLGIAFCDLTNSTINKHSVFAFLAFNSIYVAFYKDDKSLLKPTKIISQKANNGTY